jgi:hypothetical protein
MFSLVENLLLRASQVEADPTHEHSKKQLSCFGNDFFFLLNKHCAAGLECFLQNNSSKLQGFLRTSQ